MLIPISINRITPATVPVDRIAESATSAVICAKISERPDNLTVKSPSLSFAKSSRSSDNSDSKSAVACQSSVAAWNEITVCVALEFRVPDEMFLPSEVSNQSSKFCQFASLSSNADIKVSSSLLEILDSSSTLQIPIGTPVTLLFSCKSETTVSYNSLPSLEITSPSRTAYNGAGLLWNSSDSVRKSCTTGTVSSKLSLWSNPTSNCWKPINIGTDTRIVTAITLTGVLVSEPIQVEIGPISFFPDFSSGNFFGGIIIIKAGNAVMLSK